MVLIFSASHSTVTYLKYLLKRLFCILSNTY